MTKTLRISGLFAAFLLLTLVAGATTPRYSQIYIFGDSYCDVGNIFLATGGQKPAAPYFQGRFSNGPIWLDHLAGSMGLTIKPSLAGGSDYAVGGAWVTAPQDAGGFTIPSVPQQVLEYLSAHGGKADPRALYVLDGGGNDIVGTTTGSPQKLGYDIASGIVSSAILLRQAGARHFLIPNLLDVSMLPVAAPNAAFAREASLAANRWMNVLLEIENHLNGISIVRVDIFDVFNAIKMSPTHFGFTDISTPCITTAVCADPDHTLFWDAYHLSEFGQSTLAVTVESALNNAHHPDH